MVWPMLVTLLTLIPLHSAYEPPLGNCNRTWSDIFNGSGTVTFSPGIDIAESPNGGFSSAPKHLIPDPTWLVTVKNFPNASPPYAGASFWLDTAGVAYGNDTRTLFDACAFGIFTFFPKNTVELSTNDPGDCSVMLTSDCRRALMQRALDSLANLTYHATPPPHSNVSAGRLPNVCADIANAIAPNTLSNPDADPFPDECWRDYGFDQKSQFPNVVGLALTGPNSSTAGTDASDGDGPVLAGGLDYSCSTSYRGKKFFNAEMLYAARTYDFAMTQGWPILSLWFQIANEEVVRERDRIIPPTARLSCPRVKVIAKDSAAPSHLSAGHSVSNSIPHPPYHFTPGAIVGIFFGCLFAATIICVLITRYFSKRSDAKHRFAKQHGKPREVEHELGELPAANGE